MNRLRLHCRIEEKIEDGAHVTRYGNIVTTSAAKQIAEQIQDAILTGRIRGDERLPTEEELAASYGVSRPTVREALKRLAAQNLIRTRRGPAGGSFINRVDLAQAGETLTTASMMMVSLGTIRMEEIADVRLFMESQCCRAAVAAWSAGTLAKLDEALARQRDPDLTDEAFCAADVAFHRALADGGCNAMMSYLMYGVIEAFVPVTNMVIVYVRDRAEIIRLHEAMREAYARRRATQLAGHLATLLGYLRERYAEAVQQREARSRTA